MIPVFVALINAALQTNAIKEEIEQGVKETRDVAKDAREAIKLETARWDQEKSTLEAPTKEKKKGSAKDKARIAEVFSFLYCPILFTQLPLAERIEACDT